MSSSTDLPRNDFYQSEDRFTVSFYVKGLKAEDVSVSFRETSLKLILPSASYDISPFPHPIDPEQSSYRVAPVKVEIVLKKKDIGIKWNGLTGEGSHDGAFSAPHSKEETTPAVARQTKNWAKLADEAISSDGDPKAPEDVNDWFKQMFAGADENTRKAMMKSMQESGGTHLSTNWEEVSKKKVDITPPSGMDAKKWEQ